jgi:hypothetical protein
MDKPTYRFLKENARQSWFKGKSGVERKMEKFSEHLDECVQCRENPFGLCDEGASILEIEEANK